ncbi:MAG: carbamoyltransferase C-terminal domain-containing protein [Candidatus Pacebacteria bacterium]|nr:carbamoyltransferase C-terminal domain-containing protein [Candidatus Paceibacterota bacterium]
MKNIYILGLSYSHDASACLLKNGEIVVAIQKERLSRKKHDGSIFDIDINECINYCLNAEGINLSKIDLVVENSPTVLYCKEKDKILGFKKFRLLDKFDQTKIFQISHHLAHAYCAYGLSNFEDCAVMVIDGQGNYKEDITEDLNEAIIFPKNSESSYIERESFYEFSKGYYRVLRKNLGVIHKSFERLSGIGHLYESVSSYVFKSRFDAGKLMGLAPYGEEKLLINMLKVKEDGEIIYFNDWIKDFSHPNRDENYFNKYFQDYANLALKTQKELEDVVLFLSKWIKNNTSFDNLAYTGGVSLNCSANSKILNNSEFKNLFIAPPASDCGISIGCAFYGYLNILKQKKKNINYSDYLGREYSETEIINALKNNKEFIVFHKSPNICKEAAGMICDGKIIGWFQGKSEFGPRALGNRSVLADPRKSEIKDRINRIIKKRELFRPFACSILEDKTKEFFNISYSPYMLLIAIVNNDKKDQIPAVIHIDGTSRIQSVNKEQNLKYYSLINEFYLLTGIPLVLNTSFNDNEPIIETPEDALSCFLGSGLDVLCMGDYIIKRK